MRRCGWRGPELTPESDLREPGREQEKSSGQDRWGKCGSDGKRNDGDEVKMEFGPREVLVVLGALLICGIVLDGVRRMRAARRGALRGPRRQPIFDDDAPEPLNSELPSGGARVVAVRDDDATAAVGKQLRHHADAAGNRRTGPFHERQRTYQEAEPQLGDQGRRPDPVVTTELPVEEDADVAGEVLAVDPAGNGEWPRSDEELRHEEECAPARGEWTAPGEVEPRMVETSTVTASGEESPVPESTRSEPTRSEPLIPDDLPLFKGEAAPPPEPGRRGGRRRGRGRESGQEARRAPADVSLDVVVLHLMAPADTMFTALPLFDALREVGLEFGERNIFHRPAKTPGAPSAFSVANAVKPGTFEGSVGDFRTPGLAFFMIVGETSEPLAVFDDMLATARSVAATLGGDLCDEGRSTLTRQVIADYRQRLLEHCRRTRSD